MTIVAHAYPYVVGVDTHARTHIFAVLVAGTGALVARAPFPATMPGWTVPSGGPRAAPAVIWPPCG